MRHYARIPRPVKAAALAVFMLLIAAVGTGYAEADEGIPWLTSLDAAKEQAAAQNKLIFMDVFAEWCGPCKMLAPVLHEFADEHAEVKVGKVNVDEEMDLAMRFGVSSIPTLILFKNGEAVKTSVGFVPKAQLESFVL